MINNQNNNYQRHLNRLRGFCDGAGAKSMNTAYDDDTDYEKGYVDGQKAKKEYAKSVAAEFGIELREIVAMKVRGIA